MLRARGRIDGGPIERDLVAAFLMEGILSRCIPATRSRVVVNTQSRESRGSGFETCSGVWYPGGALAVWPLIPWLIKINWLGNPQVSLASRGTSGGATGPATAGDSRRRRMRREGGDLGEAETW